MPEFKLPIYSPDFEAINDYCPWLSSKRLTALRKATECFNDKTLLQATQQKKARYDARQQLLEALDQQQGDDFKDKFALYDHQDLVVMSKHLDTLLNEYQRSRRWLWLYFWVPSQIKNCYYDYINAFMAQAIQLNQQLHQSMIDRLLVFDQSGQQHAEVVLDRATQQKDNSVEQVKIADKAPINKILVNAKKTIQNLPEQDCLNQDVFDFFFQAIDRQASKQQKQTINQQLSWLQLRKKVHAKYKIAMVMDWLI